jgi:hypothetical protein
MSSTTSNSCMNKPYSQVYSLTDPRFAFFSNVSNGNIIYYSSVYKRYVASSDALIWTESTKTLSSQNITSNVSTIIDVSSTLPVSDFSFTVDGGFLYITPLARVIPLTTGQVIITYSGSIILTGSQNSLTFIDRSTGDSWDSYSSAGIFNIQGSTSGTKLQIGNTGLLSLFGTASGLTLYERLASPTNRFTLYCSSTGSLLNVDYNGSSIATITTAGITTLIPTTIQTTLGTTGTYYPSLVPLSASTSTGQIINTHASLNYNLATSTLTVPNITGTITNASGITIAVYSPSSTTLYFAFTRIQIGSTSVPIYTTNTALSYVPSTAMLSLQNINIGGTITDYASSTGTSGQYLTCVSGTNIKWSTLPVIGTGTITINAGTYLTGSGSFVLNQTTNTTISLATNGTNLNTVSTLVARDASGNFSAGTITASLTGLASLATNLNAGGVYQIVYQSASGTTAYLAPSTAGLLLQTNSTTSAPSWVNPNTLSVASSTTAVNTGTTAQTTGTFYPSFVPLSTTQTAQAYSVYSGLSYNVGTSSLITTNFTGLASSAGTVSTIAGSALLTYRFMMSTATGAATGQTVNIDPNITWASTTNILTVPTISTSITGSILNQDYYIPFTTTSTGYNTFLGASDSSLRYNPFSDMLRCPTSNVDTSRVYNTLSLYDTTIPANHFDISHYAGQLIFNNQWSTLAYPLTVDGNGGGCTITNLQVSPYTKTTSVELDGSLILNPSGRKSIGYIEKTINSYDSLITFAGSTWSIPVNGNNPNGRSLTLSLPLEYTVLLSAVTGANFALVQSFYVNTITITMLLNGVAFSNKYETYSPALGIGSLFSYQLSAISSWTIRQPLNQISITFVPTDTGNASDVYSFTMSTTSTITTTANFTMSVSLIRPVSTYTFLATRLTGTGTCTTTNYAGSTISLTSQTLTKNESVSQSLTTLRCDFLQASQVNLVYQSSFSSVLTKTEYFCFLNPDYIRFRCVITFSVPPLIGTELRFNLASATGVGAGANWTGRIVVGGNAYLSTATSTSYAIINYLFTNADQTTSWEIVNPNTATRKSLTSLNFGGTAIETNGCPITTACQYALSTAFPSCVWSVSGATNVSGTFSVYGV